MYTRLEPVSIVRLLASQQTEVKDHPASLGMTCSQHAESPAAFGFVEQDHCFKTVVTETPQGDGL